MTIDRFAGLRENLAVYRATTVQATTIPWCASCEVHHAPHLGGLCPVCAADQEDVAA